MQISPSILSADFLNLERDIKRLEEAGADSIHIDIMDGVFVSNITWGPPTVAAIRKATNLPLDVHLMVNQPERWIDDYLKTDADVITIHPESTVFLRKLLLECKGHGRKAGVALKLETPVQSIENCLDLLDVILVLTCDEGFGGQSFHPLALEKIAALNRTRLQQGLSYQIQVDGGINPETAKLCKDAGADILTAGSYVFAGDIQKAIETLNHL